MVAPRTRAHATPLLLACWSKVTSLTPTLTLALTLTLILTLTLTIIPTLALALALSLTLTQATAIVTALLAAGADAHECDDVGEGTLHHALRSADLLYASHDGAHTPALTPTLTLALILTQP